MRFLITGILFLFLNTSCLGAETIIKISQDDIRGSIDDRIEVTSFDGSRLTAVPSSNNKFTVSHGITANYYGALFLTKEGHYPETIIFKAQDKPVTIDNVSLAPLRDREKGVLTGIVYKPVTGGKLKEHEGIARTFKGERITLVKDNAAQEIITDERGIFMNELPPGEYNVLFNNKNIGKALIEKGKTAIRNIQKGAVLID